MEALNLSYTKHLGSLALGSLIHTALHVVRVIAEISENAMRNSNSNFNKNKIFV
jgi:hypothetical protein